MKNKLVYLISYIQKNEENFYMISKQLGGVLVTAVGLIMMGAVPASDAVWIQTTPEILTSEAKMLIEDGMIVDQSNTQFGTPNAQITSVKQISTQDNVYRVEFKVGQVEDTLEDVLVQITSDTESVLQQIESIWLGDTKQGYALIKLSDPSSLSANILGFSPTN